MIPTHTHVLMGVLTVSIVKLKSSFWNNFTFTNHANINYISILSLLKIYNHMENYIENEDVNLIWTHNDNNTTITSTIMSSTSCSSR